MFKWNAPTLSTEALRQQLSIPAGGKHRVVIDTDAKNEVDDQFALTWALLSQNQLEIEGLYAAPYTRSFHREPLLKAYQQIQEGRIGPVTDGENISWGGSYHDWVRRLLKEGRDPSSLQFISPREGTELSYRELHHLCHLLEQEDQHPILRGSGTFLSDLNKPIASPATEHLIERAMADDERPLYVIALAALTNVISAILIEPRIIDRIVVIWTAAYPTFSPLSNRPSMNLIQDPIASRFLFDCGVPLVYMPGYYIGVQLSLSLPDTERWVRGRGKIGDYLFELYRNNPIYEQRGITEHVGRTWIAWDLICIAWLLNPDWVPTELMPTPRLNEQLYWQADQNRQNLREAVAIKRDLIFRDFFNKLEEAP